MNTVSLLGCAQYDEHLLTKIIIKHFDNLGGIQKYIKKGTKVLLKPNLITKRNPDTAVTTHPIFMTALTKVIMESGGVVTIADCPGGPHTTNFIKSIYVGTGMEKVANVTKCNLNYDLKYKELSYSKGEKAKRFNITQAFFDADIVISVSKLKTHALTKYTGAVKNIFGLIPGLEKAKYHFRFPKVEDFCDMLIDLCLATKPTLAFMDGIVGMEGNGPSSGNPRFIGVTLASENSFHLDRACCEIIGFSTDEVDIIKRIVERKLCPQNANELDIVGDNIKDFIIKNFKRPNSSNKMSAFQRMPNFIKQPLQNYFTQIPKINNSKCIGCADCYRTCPAKTIKMQNKKAVILYKNCIKCFCCQEICPQKAINIKNKGF